jgi:cation transport ATPase
MLSGGEAVEAYAVRSASAVLEALARRMPSQAHRRKDDQVTDVPLGEVMVGDELVIFPHETCPVDGAVVDGHVVAVVNALRVAFPPRTLTDYEPGTWLGS